MKEGDKTIYFRGHRHSKSFYNDENLSRPRKYTYKRKLKRIDLIIKIQVIHSLETGIPELRETLDITIEIKDQIQLVKDILLYFHFQGLSPKQRVLLLSTINEISIKLMALTSENQNFYYKNYKALVHFPSTFDSLEKLIRIFRKSPEDLPFYYIGKRHYKYRH